MLRRHHPRAPHVRVKVANFFGLPGWKMFPQKTRLDTALLIVNQDVVVSVVVVVVVALYEYERMRDCVSVGEIVSECVRARVSVCV